MTVPSARLVLGANARPCRAVVTLESTPLMRYVPGPALVNPAAARLAAVKEPQFALVCCRVSVRLNGSETETEGKGLTFVFNCSEKGKLGRLNAGPPPTAETRSTVLPLKAEPPWLSSETIEKVVFSAEPDGSRCAVGMK